MFSTCGPNLTQICSHIIDYIPVPIGLLFAIAPTHDWNGNGATQTCTWALWLKLRSSCLMPISMMVHTFINLTSLLHSLVCNAPNCWSEYSTFCSIAYTQSCLDIFLYLEGWAPLILQSWGALIGSLEDLRKIHLKNGKILSLSFFY